ncbi:MAG: DUF5106 domain-containing protein [Dysgonamonadaceae bacterium]
MKHIYLSIILLIPFVSISCQTKKQKQQPTETVNKTLSSVQAQEIVPDTFVLPDIPSNITLAEERANYLTKHYWDRFDFMDNELLQRPEITEQAFVDYVNILNHVSIVKASESLKNMLHKIESNSTAFNHFMHLFEKYLYDPNSPFLNEEYYIPVLETAVNSSVLTETAKSRYQFQLDLAKKNRLGQIANDFTYTLASGKKGTLHAIDSKYTILMFINPGCRMCAEAVDAFKSSNGIIGALAKKSALQGELSIITVYPDTDLDEWRNYLPDMPSIWINTYDAERKITNDKIYDLKAIPTLYLLDKDKRVIFKDAKVERLLEFFQ